MEPLTSMRRLLIFLATLCTAGIASDSHIEVLVSSQAIEEKVAEYAAIIDREYDGKELTLIMVMKGSLCISADLIRHLHVPTTIEYLKASSYGENGMTAGAIRLHGLEALEIKDKHVLVVDDIFDTGKTMTTILAQLEARQPASLRSMVLLLKRVPRNTDYRPDYCLFQIENRFVIGYGLDYKERYRGLPGIYAFINDTPPDALFLSNATKG